MKFSDRTLTGHALISCAAVAMLAGCGGSQPPIGAPGVVPQTSAIATHAERGKSWTSGSRGALLYLSNFHRDSVDIYSYPDLREVGTLVPSGSVTSMCSDRSGNVWVGTINDGNGTLTEYAHGSKKPIATLLLPGADPLECD